MIPNKYGFSFIEIIIVVSILAIISWVSISSMNTNFEKQALYWEMKNLENTIINLDESIGKDITDYELYLNTGSIYYYYTNSNYRAIRQTLKLNWFTGSIKTNDTVKNNLDLWFFFNDKKINNYIFSSMWSFTGNFTPAGKYKIKTHFTEYNLNEIYINHFSTLDTKKIISLSYIQDGSGNTYTGVSIKNYIGGKKSYYSPMKININPPIQLFFESKWISIHQTLK